MKRKDAFRKLRTVCQRLDEQDPHEFKLQPLRLYLFGSVLTNKPNPEDIDSLLVYEHLPDFDYGMMVRDMTYSDPMPHERLGIKLRRGMQKVRIYLVRTSLEHWEQKGLFPVIQPQLIWQSGGDWVGALEKIEASPQPWAGPREKKGLITTEELMGEMPEEEYEAKIAQAIAKIEAQSL